MSEIVIFSLGMVVMLLIALLIIGVIVVVRLSKQVRINKDNLASVTDHDIPEIHRIISEGDEEVFRAIQESEQNLEKRIDSRVDKLKLEFDNKLNNI
jgi:predicted Holliday junction resolvase-like endonuclease